MTERPNRTRLLLPAIAVAVLAAAATWFLARDRGDASRPSRGGFVESAREAGLDFRMEFLSGEQGERFKINFYDHGAGVAVADVDGDGDDDVYFCNQLGANALYLNDGKARFSDATEVAGVGLADRVSTAAVFADVDEDGDQDLYVATTRGGNVFFRNRGDGTFEDATAAAGLTLVAHSQSATFFDADRDGHPDLLVSNTARWTTDVYDEQGKYFVGPEKFFDLVLRSPKEANVYYRNRGDGTFEDATQEAGLSGDGWSGDTAVFDLEGDGDLDVFVANMFGRSRLYANDGKGRFRDVASSAIGRMSWGTVGTRAFDYDGDGVLDLLLVDMHSDMWMQSNYEPDESAARTKHHSVWGPRGQQDPEHEKLFEQRFGASGDDMIFGNSLFRGLGGGRFEEMSGRAGVETLWPWGIATGDFDGDGFEDVYLASGMGHPYRYWRSPLLVNQGDGTFVDRAHEAGLDPPPDGIHVADPIAGHPAARSGRAVATADFDGDGRLDFVTNGFNDRTHLFLNRFPARRFVKFRLTGTESGRDAVGALVRLRVGGRTLLRQVGAAGGYLSQSSKTLHFGLGDATKIDACEIRWPSGAVQTLDAPAVDALHAVVEPRR